MLELTIGWKYLTGYAVATDPSSRERAEWPPHPGRVFMAMAAAWFETGEDRAEGDALRWLETLGDPELYLPPQGDVFERSLVTVYVPVNDKSGPAMAALQSAPTMTRSRQPRTFPRVRVGNTPCFMAWSNVEGVGNYRDALDRLCRKVTRIGHSSSLVQMWVASCDEYIQSGCDHFVCDDLQAELHTRILSSGLLDMLINQYGEEPRRRKAKLEDRVDTLTAQKKAIKGKGSKEQRIAIDKQVSPLNEDLQRIMPPPPVRPKLGLWSGYRRADRVVAETNVRPTHFDPDMLVLSQVAGPQLPMISTLTVTRSLRSTVMTRSGTQPVPQWVSGHQPDGSASDDESGHLACIPLPFVGHEHADGHLLGVGLVFPRALNRQERGRVLGPLLMNSDGQPCEVELKLGQLGLWTVKKRDWTEQRGTLQPETWTAHPKGATTWASVTPVVLDRFPKAARVKGRAAWTDEVVAIISGACTRIGLPTPVDIDIDTTCWHRGGPRAVGKRRPLRGSVGTDATMGDGFPFYPAKGANASRPQVHVWLKFAQPVVGPMLLGAGRYQGYGLCKPVNGSKEAGR